MSGEIILVVDDEAPIRELARMYLEQDGYRVIMAVNGQQALDQVRQQTPDLVVLDLMLPGIDGWEVCRRLRAQGHLPILMLTARDDDIDKIVGLEMGADDYLTKPFNPREMVARVRAILRRAAAVPSPQTELRRLGNLTLNPISRDVLIADRRIELRSKEFDLLLTLMDHQNMVLSREQLLDLVWGYEFYGQTRTVDVHIAHLRDRLAGSNVKIETVWGKGYKLLVEA
ncbi:MAG: response regulator transcription factor [Chloroflexi bacterium]|nr:response regulator transcription factor [Chloroflexota bacterium]MBP8057910.1 response regulator transcription factor [Chloroflexota bacterium]